MTVTVLGAWNTSVIKTNILVLMNLIFNGVRETIKIKANKAIIYRLDSVVLWGNSWWGLSGAREEHGWNLKMFSRGGVIHWQGDSWSWTWKQRGRQLCCIWGRGVSNNDAGTKLLKQKGIWHVVRQEKKEQCGGQCVWSKASRWGEEKCKLTQQDKGGEGGSQKALWAAVCCTKTQLLHFRNFTNYLLKLLLKSKII